MAPATFLDHLRPLADDTGRLPPWTSWFDGNDVAALFPNAAARARVEAQQHGVALACLDATIDVPAGWDARATGYLAFGDTYAAEQTRALERGWPVVTLDGGHLHMLDAPKEVAAVILDLLLEAGDGRWDTRAAGCQPRS